MIDVNNFRKIYPFHESTNQPLFNLPLKLKNWETVKLKNHKTFQKNKSATIT